MRAIALLVIAFFLLQGQAPPEPVVTLCAADDQPGPGVNLTTALRSPGRVTFNCHSSATILIHQMHTISRDTVIDGGRQITLDASGSNRVFSVDANAGLTLIGLTVVNGNGGNGSVVSSTGQLAVRNR